MKTGRLLMSVGALFGCAFVLTFAVALHTDVGRHYDEALYRHVSGNGLASVATVGERALATIDVGSVTLGAAVVGLLALVRGARSRALAAVGLVGASIGSAEFLKHGLPHVAGAVPSGRLASFPSGHTTVAVSLGLALVLAAPPLLRPTAALVGATYSAGVGLALVAVGSHFPSDVIGSFFLCGFWACVAGAISRASPRRETFTTLRVVISLAVLAVGLLTAAVVAGRHQAAVNALRTRESLVATAVLLGLLSLATFGLIAALVEEEPRSDHCVDRMGRAP